METCVFCKIVRNELEAFKIYEDDMFLGFLDHKPLNLGNSLLIPKQHFRWVYDVIDFGKYWEAAKKIAVASIKVLEAESVSFLTLGYEVEHAHIRIIPRFQNDLHRCGICLKDIQKFSEDEMAVLSKKIFETI
jgi:histidine triad (HIT) family protein